MSSLGRTVGCFSPLDAYTVASGAKKVLWEKTLMSDPAQRPVGPVSEVHGFFIRRDLPSTSVKNQVK